MINNIPNPIEDDNLARPDQWEEIFLQDHAKKILQYYLDKNVFYHAYFFQGEKGVGKTSMARIFAKLIVCQNRKKYSYCGECVCLNHHFNIREINGASCRGINDIAPIIKDMCYAPLYGYYKVLIIDEAHKLTDDAFSSLLKFIEEPPKHVIVIFVSTEKYGLLETIYDRCLLVEFHTFTPIDIYNFLLNKNICDDREIIFYCANRSQGSLRRANVYMNSLLSPTSPDEREINYETRENFMFFLNNKNQSELMDKVQNFMQNNINLHSFWNAFSFFLLFVGKIEIAAQIEIILKNNTHFSSVVKSYLIVIKLAEYHI